MSEFINRHIGPREHEIKTMLKTLQVGSLEELMEQATPPEIRTQSELNLPSGITEKQCIKNLFQKSNLNQIFKSYIGHGYYETQLPTVIQRNILENPVWLTSYTPYQSEISQGRLQALLNFQTMITELTEMDLANAGLLDEGTACAEAVSMAYNHRSIQTSDAVLIDQGVFLQTRQVIETRAHAIGLTTVIDDVKKFKFNKHFFCVVIQTPAANGTVQDWELFCQKAKENNIQTIFSADLLSLCLFKTPGTMGADIVVGSCQRLGLPMMYGGPHSAYLATNKKYARSLPGRIVGVSKNRHDQPALRLALQVREQHIRRERATSNICTAQSLLAVISGMFAIYHGPWGLKQIALKIHSLALLLKKHFKCLNLIVPEENIFDTVEVKLTKQQLQDINNALLLRKTNVKISDDSLSFSINQTTSLRDICTILALFYKTIKAKTPNIPNYSSLRRELFTIKKSIHRPSSLKRLSNCLKHPVFRTYHSETRILRYIHSLQNQDLSLTHSMIPLGSCTMKLNASVELLPISWPRFAFIHPFAPLNQTEGYQQIIKELEESLCEITGFDSISFQPNAGSQGEYAGLLAVRSYHEERFQKKINLKKRDICLIPISAHGTNPASAKMAGLQPVSILCDQNGNICHTDLKQKIKKYKNTLACLMITYPSTFGVFEKDIPKICEWVHASGGLVYLDGANMNALVGISRPAEWGADLCHLNLHKTFCIPHGGGGPGVGPIAVKKFLNKFLPGHFMFRNQPLQNSEPLQDLEKLPGFSLSSPVSSAPWGSAGILMIPWAYIKLMGSKGLKKATQVAILNANYIANQLNKNFKILYTNLNKRVAHECIIDVRKFKNTAEVTVNDIAKRLIDYGFHAPTMSWPVPGTLMAEPTESEDKQELDRFCTALIEIRKEIKEIEEKKYSTTNNVLKNAPHVLEDVINKKWDFPYSQEKAFYPLPWVKKHKFWTPSSRIKDAYGDINLFCTCPKLSES